jgi:hypothetical protein
MHHQFQKIPRLNFLSACLSLFFPLLTAAQDHYYSDEETCKSRSGLEYGGIAGFYIPGNGTADFYSGKPEKENNANYVFRNKYWYDEIYYMLNANDTVFIREYPENMRYNPAFSFGLFAKYDLNCRTGIYLQFSYAKLRARDMISVEVDPPVDYLAEPDIRLFSIYGTEERNLVDLGFTHAFGNSRVARFTLGGGVNMNNTLVEESALRIEEKVYNLVNVYGTRPYVPGGTQQAYEIRQGGIGFGVFGTIGARFEFSQAIAIEPGLTVYYKQINLESARGFYPQYNFFVKICFRDLLTFSD